jgi:hypothetical protein
MARFAALVALSLALVAVPRSARADSDNPYPCMFCLFEIRVAHGEGWILPNEHMNTFLDLSPDREQMLFWEYHDVAGTRPFIGRETIYGKRTRMIVDVDFTFVSEQRADWSPDGRRIAFPLSRGVAASCRGRALWVANVDGTDAHRVTGPCTTGRPVWSPDSRRLAFFDDGALSTVALDGSDLRRLDAPTTRSSTPAWSPDGRSSPTTWARRRGRRSASSRRTGPRSRGTSPTATCPCGRRMAVGSSSPLVEAPSSSSTGAGGTCAGSRGWPTSLRGRPTAGRSPTSATRSFSSAPTARTAVSSHT